MVILGESRAANLHDASRHTTPPWSRMVQHSDEESQFIFGWGQSIAPRVKLLFPPAPAPPAAKRRAVPPDPRGLRALRRLSSAIRDIWAAPADPDRWGLILPRRTQLDGANVCLGSAEWLGVGVATAPGSIRLQIWVHGRTPHPRWGWDSSAWFSRKTKRSAQAWASTFSQ